MLLGVPSIRINIQAVEVCVFSEFCKRNSVLTFLLLQNGQTALIRAIVNGQNEIVRILLDYPGVDVNLIQKVK